MTAEQRLQQLNDYVHLNPVRAKLLGKRDRIASINSFRWVGPEYYGEKRRESAEAKAERIVGGIKKDAVDGADSVTAARIISG